MTNYAKHVSRKTTPQTEKAAKGQKKNVAGGYTFVIDDWQRLERFLILGSEGGTYYVSEKKLTKSNAKCVERLLKKQKDGLKLVQVVTEMSQSGRAPKNDPAIFALVLAASSKHEKVRKAALDSLPQVCRTGTHLFHFAAMVNELRGWGRGLRKAVARWYNEKPVDKLAYQLVKYQQRDGWSNKDLLRLSHAGTDAPTEQHNAAYRWVVAGNDLGEREVLRRSGKSEQLVTYGAVEELPRLIQVYEQLKEATSEKEVVKMIEEHRFTHEMVPNQFKKSPAVWEALLQHMPVGAMLRNLGKLTNVGVIAPLSSGSQKVAETLTNLDVLKRGRVHPLSVLVALKTYANGRGLRGSLTWSPNQSVVDALDEGFYLSFDAVEPTGKKMLLALDASGSMSAPIAGTPLTCLEAACALAMVTARTEKNYHLMYFSAGKGSSDVSDVSGIADLPLSPRQRLDTVVKKVSRLNWGGTDCSLPMRYVNVKNLDVDAFVVLTDNDTYVGPQHPFQALEQYRNKVQHPVKSVVVGMTATQFSIAEPKDPHSLDVVGFDTATPDILSNFIKE